MQGDWVEILAGSPIAGRVEAPGEVVGLVPAFLVVVRAPPVLGEVQADVQPAVYVDVAHVTGGLEVPADHRGVRVPRPGRGVVVPLLLAVVSHEPLEGVVVALLELGEVPEHPGGAVVEVGRRVCVRMRVEVGLPGLPAVYVEPLGEAVDEHLDARDQFQVEVPVDVGVALEGVDRGVPVNVLAVVGERVVHHLVAVVGEVEPQNRPRPRGVEQVPVELLGPMIEVVVVGVDLLPAAPVQRVQGEYRVDAARSAVAGGDRGDYGFRDL